MSGGDDVACCGAGLRQLERDDGIDRLTASVWSSRTPIQR